MTIAPIREMTQPTTMKLIHMYVIYQVTDFTYLAESIDHTDMMTTSTMLDIVLTSMTAIIMTELQVNTGDILTLTTEDIKASEDHNEG